jgi:hypothetical protein
MSARDWRQLLPPITPKLVLRVLLGVLLFIVGMGLGLWLILFAKRYEKKFARQLLPALERLPVRVWRLSQWSWQEPGPGLVARVVIAVSGRLSDYSSNFGRHWAHLRVCRASWDFTARWFASFASIDQCLREQGRNRRAGSGAGGGLIERDRIGALSHVGTSLPMEFSAAMVAVSFGSQGPDSGPSGCQ